MKEKKFFETVKNTEMGKRKENVIYMRCLGMFNITVGEEPLLKGKTKESQFTLLMLCLLHQGAKGVTREQLEDMLFSDRDIDDKHHALQSVIYNAKKKLKSMGFPDYNYIELRNGIYFWTEKIEVVEDAAMLEQLYEKGLEEMNLDKKLEYFKKACLIYNGDFLEEYSTNVWVAAETRKYRMIFEHCVKECAHILQEKGDFANLKELGEYASSRVRFADYEMITMDALIGMGNYQESFDFYKEIEQDYLKLQLNTPSLSTSDYLNRLASKIANPVDTLNVIQSKMNENDSREGAYFCSYPVFKGIYQLMQRLAARKRFVGCLVLCTLTDAKYQVLRENEVPMELTNRLQDIICATIRKGDIATRYGYGQFLLLLADVETEQCEYVKERIDKKFLWKNRKYKISYTVNEILPVESNRKKA